MMEMALHNEQYHPNPHQNLNPGQSLHQQRLHQQQPQQHIQRETYHEPSIGPPTSFADLEHQKEVLDAEQELALLNRAIEEAQARQKSLKEHIASANADIAAATKTLNAKRDRATDVQQVCASMQQGHAGLKTVLAEAALLPHESEGVEKMRARLFLVRANGQKARNAIQVNFIKLLAISVLHITNNPCCCRFFKTI